VPRSIWSGAISFGLVNVPVKLWSALTHKEVRFHLLHDADGARIELKRFCSQEEVEVPYEHVVKGYELGRGRYVTLTEEEIKAADPVRAHTIDIQDFVALAEIDPIFYEHTYYVAPGRGAEKAYGLLLGALRKTERVGIARFFLRTKETLCCVRPMGAVLALSTMSYADEIVSPAELDLPAAPAPTAREAEMAVRLVESLSAKFDPKRYPDEHRRKLLALVKRKQAGEAIATEPPPKLAPVVDLADALARSLEAGERRGASAAAHGGRRRAPHRHAARTAGKRRGTR
jgi:DNA end-binding protein Ku